VAATTAGGIAEVVAGRSDVHVDAGNASAIAGLLSDPARPLGYGGGRGGVWCARFGAARMCAGTKASTLGSWASRPLRSDGSRLRATAQMPNVSVVIPAYNPGRMVSMAVESVLTQTRPAREVIIIDDGSTDDAAAALTRFGDRVRVVRQENLGVAAARNRGAWETAGDLIAFLDADDEWLPEKLERQVALFEGEPSLGLVHCGYEEIDVNGRSQGRSIQGRRGDDVWREMLLFEPSVLGGGSGSLISRRAFEEVGGFDRRLSTSADWDLYFRIARRHPVNFVPEVLMRYRVHGGNMHTNVRAMERDMLLAFSKAFADPDPQLAQVRRLAYGKLHAVLAGSYFAGGQYWGFLRHATSSLLLAPRQTARHLGSRRKSRKSPGRPV
jgi:glycosyltransferase involved in cell wall biosynthesis